MEIFVTVMMSASTTLLAYIAVREFKRKRQQDGKEGIVTQAQVLNTVEVLQRDFKTHTKENGIHLTQEMLSRVGKIESDVGYMREKMTAASDVSADCQKQVMKHETRIAVMENKLTAF